MATYIICGVTCLAMIVCVLFFPNLRLGKVHLSTYWMVTLLGAVVLLASGQVDAVAVGSALTADTAINPLKILVLFVSMTVLSVFLDENGFFRYFANAVLKRAKRGQYQLFFALYALVSVLTVFTSNDVIILSFTPFICYFAKHAKIDPRPYLAAEFVAANTWSMALIIGNPTNIYLATALGVDFVSYLKVSILPTVAAGAVSLLLLFLLFRKKLKTPIEGEAEEVHIEDRAQLIAGLVHLGVCTVMLAVASYLGLEMWYIALGSVGSLFVVSGIISIVKKKHDDALFGCIRRAPYELIPFVLSMFVLIVGLEEQGATAAIANFFGENLGILKYGVSSFLTANLINNIPMSVLFSSILSAGNAGMGSVFATIIGSNLGALLTPVGALAGIMWSHILHRHGVKFGYLDFLKTGIFVAVPALAAALGVLAAVLLI